MSSHSVPDISSALAALTLIQSPTTKPVGMSSLPNEIYMEIAEKLCTHCSRTSRKRYTFTYELSKINLYNLCLVDKRWSKAATPSLYHDFKPDQNKTFLLFLRTLIQHPDLAIHVRTTRLTTSFRWRDYDYIWAFKDIIRYRALALGIPPSEHMRFWTSKSSCIEMWDKLQDFLDEMLLLHTPNIVSFRLLGRTDLLERRAPFRYLNIVARSSRQWHGMRCLRHVKCEVGIPIDSPESHHMAYLSSLASVAPNVRQLSIIAYSLPPIDPASVTAHPTPAYVVAFLGGIRSLQITSRIRIQSVEGWPSELIGHCKSVEEVRYGTVFEDAASFVQLMRPLSPTLKRLGVTLYTISGKQTVWDYLGDDSAALFETIVGLTSLEVLRLDATVYPSSMAASGANRPHMTVLFMRALPKPLCVLSISGCKRSFLKKCLSQLTEQIQNSKLPSFRTLHVAWDCVVECHPFIEELAELGIDMKVYSNGAWWNENKHAVLEAEEWMQ